MFFSDYYVLLGIPFHLLNRKHQKFLEIHKAIHVFISFSEPTLSLLLGSWSMALHLVELLELLIIKSIVFIEIVFLKLFVENTQIHVF